jgi:AAA domain
VTVEDLKGRAEQALAAGRGEQLRARLLTAAEVIKRPPPELLVEGLLFRTTLALLYGQPKSFKSFLALDLALSIAGGRDWSDRTTAHGPVVYVAAEGLAGLGKRIQAWEQAYGFKRTATGEAFYVLPEKVRLLEFGDVAALVDLTRLVQPRLVVLDTLNRCLVGGDENDSEDMGRAVDAIDQVRQAGTTVLVVHHADKAGRHYRGHSSLEGAVDTVLKLERAGKVITLTTEAQKDAEEAAPIQLRTTREQVGDETSLVLYCHGGNGSTTEEMAPAETAVLELLGSTFGQRRVVLAAASHLRATRTFVLPGAESPRRTGCDREPG